MKYGPQEDDDLDLEVRLKRIREARERDLPHALLWLRGPFMDPLPQVRRAILGRWDVSPEEVVRAIHEDPDAGVRAFAATLPAVPAALVVRLADDPDFEVRAAVARRGDCPRVVRERLAYDQNSIVAEAALQHATSGELVRVLRMGHRPLLITLAAVRLEPVIGDHVADLVEVSEEAALALLRLTTLPGELIGAFAAAHRSRSVRVAAVEHAHCPVPALVSAAADADARVRFLVAGHRSVPVAVLEELSHDADPDVRRAVCSHEACPVAVLRRAGEDESDAVRKAALEHPGVPVEVVELLTRDPVSSIRAKACRHAACPPEALVPAARDSSLDVRFACVGHQAVPPEALAILTSDLNRTVRRKACEHDRCPGPALLAAATDVDVEVRLAVAAHRRTPAAAHEILARDEAEAVRLLAAVSRKLSPASVGRLVTEDPLLSVRRAAVQNPACPRDVLVRAGLRKNLLLAAVENSACDATWYFRALRVIAGQKRAGRADPVMDGQRLTPGNAQQVALKACAGLARAGWAEVARHPIETLHEADLRRLVATFRPDAARDPRVEVRRALAGLPDLSGELLTLLSADPDEHVRALVTARILAAATPRER